MRPSTTKSKSSAEEQEPDPSHLARNGDNGEASTDTIKIRKSGRKKSDTKQNASAKKKTKKQKEKDKEQLTNVSEDVKYLSDVVEFRQRIFASLNSTSKPAQTKRFGLFGTLPAPRPGFRKKTSVTQKYTSGLGEFEVFGNDFETSEEEEIPLDEQEPTVFLADLKQDLAEAIYKSFAKHCKTFFDDKWLAWLDKLLWINARDYRWVENMRRVHAGLPPYRIYSKDEAKWVDEDNFITEECIRARDPKEEDYEWTLAEVAQQEEVNYKDLELAKTYAKQRGIPWEKVLNFVEEEDDGEDDGGED